MKKHSKNLSILLEFCVFFLCFLLLLLIPIDMLRTKTAEKLTGYDVCFSNNYFYTYKIKDIVVDCYLNDEWGDAIDYKTCRIDVFPSKLIVCKNEHND